MIRTKMFNRSTVIESRSSPEESEISYPQHDVTTTDSELTITQRAAIGFFAGVVGALAVVISSHIVAQFWPAPKGPIPFPLRFSSPGIYQPLFWGGLWGILFGLVMKTDWKRFYLIGFSSYLAPMLATFLYFLPKGGAGYFGLKQAEPSFPLYILLVNLPFGIVIALVTKAVIESRRLSTATVDLPSENRADDGALTLSQRATMCFGAGVAGALAVVIFSHILHRLGIGEMFGVDTPASLKSPEIYKPLFWGGLWGILFGLIVKPAWNRLYLFGFLFVVAPLLALFLFFLPISGAGFFGLQRGPEFAAYLLLVNLPFGIVTALAARAIIGKHP